MVYLLTCGGDRIIQHPLTATTINGRDGRPKPEHYGKPDPAVYLRRGVADGHARSQRSLLLPREDSNLQPFG